MESEDFALAMERSQELESAPIGRLLWHFSWPSLVAMTCSALYNIVDRAFVGRGIGPLAIAATTVAFPIMMILFSLSLLIGVGATALISIRLGEQKKEEAEMIAANAVTLLILLPLFFSMIYLLFPEPILRFFGANAEILPYARDFTQIIMLGSVLGSLGMGMNNFIRAEGHPVMAMSTQVLGTIINGVLNYIFIFKMGLGIKGSALATVLGQLSATIWVLSYYFTGHSLIRLKTRNLLPRLPIVLDILSIGFAPCALEITNCLQQLILNKTVMFYSGDRGLSVVGIIMSIGTLLFMPIIGISQGAQPIIGFNYGARRFERVKETLKKAIIISSCISVAGYLILRIWPLQIAGIFTKGDDALTQMTAHAMNVFFGMIFVIGFQIVSSQYFQAVGKGAQAAILSLSRQFLLFIPLLLILPHFWGINGVWRTAPIADTFSVLLTAYFIINEMRLLPKEASNKIKIPKEASNKIQISCKEDMKMKVVGIVGSPRSGGNTEILVKTVLAGAAEVGAETELYRLNDLRIRGCQGCFYCQEHGSCRQKDDDMPLLYDAMLAADGIVIGSPIYMGYLSGQTKLFLDRLFAFLKFGAGCSLPAGKRCALVYTQGGGEDGKAVMESLASFFANAMGMDVKGIVGGNGLNELVAVKQRHDLLEKATQIGRKLVD